MAPIDVSSALAAERIRDLRRTAASDRLAALASCCLTPARVTRERARAALGAMNAWIRRGQLGPAADCCIA